MILSEILELLNAKGEGWTKAKIAKEKLTIGEKKLGEVLDDLGFEFSNVAPKGWKYNGDESKLDKSIYDFVTTPRKKTKTKATAIKKVGNPEIQEVNKPDKPVNSSSQTTPTTNTIKKSNPSNKEEINPIKKVTYEIEENTHLEIKIKALREKRNVSELVNEALKNYLKGEKN